MVLRNGIHKVPDSHLLQGKQEGRVRGETNPVSTEQIQSQAQHRIRHQLGEGVLQTEEVLPIVIDENRQDEQWRINIAHLL